LPSSAELATREDHACLLELAPRQLGARARETTRYDASAELATVEIQAVSRVTFARALHLDHFE